MIEVKNKMKYDLEARTAQFGERCILLCKKMTQDTIGKIVSTLRDTMLVK